MKKSHLAILAIALIAITYAATSYAETSQVKGGEYIFLRWFPYSVAGKSTVVINYGGVNTEKIELTKDQQKDGGIPNAVLDLMNKFNNDGYTLVSSVPLETNGATAEIISTFKKTNN